ncbi:MAG: pntB [Thermoleophilia bacterium]|nr:pntB [Thermoleophilia bacterium]
MNVHDPQFIDMLYLAAAALFIVGLRRLGSPRTARSGNTVAGVGMLVGLVATLLLEGFDFDGVGFVLIVVGVVIGTVAGVVSARAVKMTAMPQMVAFFNGLGGGCVALISMAEYQTYLESGHEASNTTLVGIVLGSLIGAVSFTGSIIAFAKLQELLSGRPVTWPLQRSGNAILLAGAAALGVWLVAGAEQGNVMLGIVAIAAVLGVCVVLPIGGADMPVIISLLNSLTGLAACAAGFALGNSLLIVAGIIVGASGFLLTKMMGEAMNRTIASVLFGAFGGDGGQAGGGALTHGTVRVAGAEDVAIMLAYSRRVVIVPGYGLAVAQAQHTVRELSDLLESKGVHVSYGIHPVAGRMPGHMNVLLAEANVPYEQLKEMDEVNPEFKQTDVVLVIGANDVVNPSAKTEPGSPLFGMPVLNVEEARAVVVMKRGMSTGFAGVDNPLFVAPNTQMLFGDAKASLSELVTAVGAV